jgi:hypothetical protein
LHKGNLLLFEEDINNILTSIQAAIFRNSFRHNKAQTKYNTSAMNLLPKFLLIVNLIHSIGGINQDFTSKFIVNAKRNADKVSETANSKISKLRLILLGGDVNNQNEIVRKKKRNTKKEAKIVL